MNNYYTRNKEKYLAKAKAWAISHPQRRKEISRVNQQKMRPLRRARLLELLGPFCNLCGEMDEVVLEIDHTVPQLRSRPEGSGGSGAILSRLRVGKENPFNLQVLCSNCHRRKTKMESQHQWS